MYINHNNSFDNNQYVACLVLLIKDILSCIKRIFPDITRVILQSDNARSYQNSIVPFFVHILSLSTGLFVSCFIRTDTGAGKGMIDGHFATMIKILRAYVDVVFNVYTLT